MKPLLDRWRGSGGLTEMLVAGNYGAIADFRDKIGGVGMAIAVDHEPRGGTQNCRGIEDFRERFSDARRADVPGDVPGEFRRRQAEVV